MQDFVIGNVTVIDGTGAAPSLADVAVAGDRIVDLAEAGSSAAPAVDGTGLVLSPGFVDVHTHDDLAVVLDPDHSCKTLQGVTSVVVGNCGISAAPASDHTPGLTTQDRIGDYLRTVEDAGPAVNVGTLIGHGAIRGAVMGLRTDRAPEPNELSAMLEHVAAAMDDGALGLSTGLAYEPGRYAAADEVEACARLVAEAGGIYTTHMRDEAGGLLDSIDEALAVAETTGVPLQISHLKASGHAARGLAGQALARIDAAVDRGVDVMADQYPYTRGSTLLEQVVNAGALDGPSAFGHLAAEQILVAAAPRHPEWEGRTVQEIADVEGESGRVMADRLVEAEGRHCMVVLDTMDEDDVQAIMAHSCVMVGSDGVPLGSKPHPRLHHTYPRVLGHYVRDLGILDLPDAIRRMTSAPAARFGFVDRGVIRPGAFADLVLFDPATIVDTGTYTDPTAVPAGVAGVWVNGERAVTDGVVTGTRPGRVVRRP